MKVFLSWSGSETKSHAVARALDEWLPTVLNAVEPWVSSRGLIPGLQWNQQLDKELDETSFGIIVVTPWNQHSQWLNFEAGALSKRVGGLESRVAPLLIDFPNVAQLTGPLSGYQVVLPTRAGILSLVGSLNQALGVESRRNEVLERAFDVCWPALEEKLRKINSEMPSEEDPGTAPSPQPAAADDADMLSEILNAVRALARSDARLTDELRQSASSKNGHSTGREKVWMNADQNSLLQRRISRRMEELGFAVASVRRSPGGTVTVRLAQPHDPTTEQQHAIINGVDWDRFHITAMRIESDAEAEEPVG